jgi:hypothetical protein
MTTPEHTTGDRFRPAGGPPLTVAEADAEAVARGWADDGFYRIAVADFEIADAVGDGRDASCPAPPEGKRIADGRLPNTRSLPTAVTRS